MKAFMEIMGINRNKFKQTVLLTLGFLLFIMAGCTGQLFNETSWSSVVLNVENDSVVYGSAFGGIISFDPITKRKLWQYPETDNPDLRPVYATPLSANGLIYFGDSNGTVWAVNSQGKDQWEFSLDGSIYGDPIIDFDNETVFIGSTKGVLYALNANSGLPLWRFPSDDTGPIHGGIWGTPAIDQDTLYIPGMDKYLYAVDIVTGAVKWKFETSGQIAGTPLVEGNSVYFGSFDSNLYSVDRRNGEEKWRFASDNWFWTLPTLVDGTLYAGGLDHRMYALDSQTGQQEWRFQATGPIRTTVTPIEDGLVFGTEDHMVYAVGLFGNELWKHDLGSSVYSHISLIDGSLFVVGQDGLVHVIETDRGSVLWDFDSRAE
jgi:outer membrane protein assembly factor BamB